MPKRRYSKKKSPQVKDPILPVKHDNLAGIDLGSREHWVAVPGDRDAQPVRPFGTCTRDLLKLIEWLVACGIDSVAIESTGVYWIPLYDLLEARGFGVKLVDSSPLKHLVERKTDPNDSAWLQALASLGLMRSAVRPAADVQELRSLTRLRSDYAAKLGRASQRMSKAMIEMNIRLDIALSDIAGTSGLKIIDAILAGERDSHVLVKLCHTSVKATPDELACALEGTYAPYLLTQLRLARQEYTNELELLRICDQHIADWIKEHASKEAGVTEESYTSIAHRHPQRVWFDHNKRGSHPFIPALTGICNGVDLLQLPCLNILSILQLIGELGTDMSRWRNAKAFTNYLGLVPRNEMTGGRIINRRTRRRYRPRAALVFRQAAESLSRSNHPLADFYRKQRARKGGRHAIVAAARKLAQMYYIAMTTGKVPEYDLDEDQKERRLEKKRKYLEQQAKELGFRLEKAA